MGRARRGRDPGVRRERGIWWVKYNIDGYCQERLSTN